MLKEAFIQNKMQIQIALPDEIVRDLTARWGSLERPILELIVVQAYRDGVISAGKVRELLGFATRLEVDAFLQQKGALLSYDLNDLDVDQQTHARLRFEGKLSPWRNAHQLAEGAIDSGYGKGRSRVVIAI